MPPRLTVVVHGPEVRGRFAECLESVERQATPERPGVEIVVAGTDAAARGLAEEAAARDPRFVPLPLPDSTPDAEARLAGAQRASGEWLLFVRGKDRLPVGSLRAATGAIELCSTAVQTHPADVILMDHVRTTWRTEAAPSPDGPLLARAGHTPAPPDARPELLGLVPLLGDRLVRSAFWDGQRDVLAAGNERYTAYALLLAAGRVGCADQIVLEDRVERAATLPPPTADGPFGLIEPYVAADRLLTSLHRPAALRHRLYDSMTHEWLRVVSARTLPGAAAEEFFRAASGAARACRPPGHERPEGLEGVRQSLLEAGAYRAYLRLAGLNDRRRGLRATVRRQRHKLGGKVRARRYRGALERPLDPHLAVFSAYWDRGVACNPGAIAEELRRLAPHIHPVWVVSGARVPLLPPGTDHIVPGTPRYSEVMARATYLVNNVNFPNSVVKRPGQVHVQTHHGTPLKCMGLDQIPYPAAAKGLDFRQLLRRVDKWDYSVTANAHSTRMWQRAYPSGYTELEHGYPRNDVFYAADAERVRTVRARLGIPPGARALLYAPTHRDYEAAWSPRLDLARLAERLGPDTVLLVRGHYFYSGTPTPLAGLRAAGRVLDVSAYDPVEELALAADALITDYSSIMFDYANLDRPIVVYADDWEVYRHTRGVYFDLLAEAPGPLARTGDELAEIFTSGAWNDPASAAARTVFRRRFCEFDDGRAAERVVRRVFLGTPEARLPPVLPLHERTPAPTPEEAVRR